MDKDKGWGGGCPCQKAGDGDINAWKWDRMKHEKFKQID